MREDNLFSFLKSSFIYTLIMNVKHFVNLYISLFNSCPCVVLDEEKALCNEIKG